jgi:hypothetical protein
MMSLHNVLKPSILLHCWDLYVTSAFSYENWMLYFQSELMVKKSQFSLDLVLQCHYDIHIESWAC